MGDETEGDLPLVPKSMLPKMKRIMRASEEAEEEGLAVAELNISRQERVRMRVVYMVSRIGLEVCGRGLWRCHRLVFMGLGRGVGGR